MTRTAHPVELSTDELRSLKTTLRRGTTRARVQTRARVLDLLHPITGEYPARMEDLLHLYRLPYDEQRPVVCFDELPMQLTGEVVAPLPMKEGRSMRFDYEYVREGTAALLVASEPLTYRRPVETSPRRTKADYCRFMRRVAEMFPHSGEGRADAGQPQHGQRRFLLRELAARGRLLSGAGVRDALDAEERLASEGTQPLSPRGSPSGRPRTR
jgi:hypothetical protein